MSDEKPEDDGLQEYDADGFSIPRAHPDHVEEAEWGNRPYAPGETNAGEQ
jgi:hypothetical protein